MPYLDGLPVAATVSATDIMAVDQGGTPGLAGTATTRQTTLAAVLQLGTGPIQGPGSSVNGDLVTWNGTTGKLLADLGIKGSAIIPQIASIAALQAATTTTNPNSVMYVIGYRTGADGGEGMFWYNAADTTGADNGGTIIVDASGRRWYRETGGAALSVKWFGAQGNSTADDTAAIQAAISAAITTTNWVYVPPGNFIISGTLTASNAGKPLSIYGAGKYTTTITTNSASATMLSLALEYHHVYDITFSANVTRTNSSHIVSASNIGNLTRVHFDNYFRGFSGSDNAATLRDLLMTNPALHATGLLINGYADAITIDNISFYTGTHQADAGIQILQCGGMLLSNSNIVGQGIDLLINPGNGQVAAAIWCTNTYFDTAASGIVIEPAGSGSVVRCKFTQCWSSSHSGDGVTIANAGLGIVAGIEFVNHMANSCGAAGFNVNSGAGSLPTGVSIIGGSFCNNVTGIGFAAGTTDFTIQGVQAGAYGGLSGNSNVGISIATGASDRYVILGNRVHGNTSGGLVDGGTGSVKYVAGNLA